MSPIINGFIIISLLFTFGYFIGLLTFINDHEENKCDMTFMFEYPQFVRISNEVDERYPKYGLYAYSEGRLTEKTRNMYFDGIPVLFIPGNAGSYRQVRSLASIALRKAYNSRTPFHFDYFAIDFNEELSGLNGALLTEQISYVNSSINRILDLYEKRWSPAKSIILFGHSMGGVIARKLALDLPEDSQLVPIVLTLASPHKRPPLILDDYLFTFYNEIKSRNTSTTTFISVTGGYADFLVPSLLTTLSNDRSNLHVVSTHIPKSWLVADHLCILWCKQLILAINRALFDSVDSKTKQISTNFAFRRSVFHHHLVHHSGTSSHMRNNYAVKANIRNDGEWIEHFGRQFTIHLNDGVREPHFYMVRLINQRQHEALTVVAINLKTTDWAFVCGAHIPKGTSRVCEDFAHLTQLSEISPSAKHKRRTLNVNMHKLMKQNEDYTHIVLRVLPTDKPVIFYVDVYNENERKKLVNLPFLFSFQRKVIYEETPENTIRFELILPQLELLIQSYQLFVESIKCSHEFRHATASLIVPWGNQDYHKHFTKNDSEPMHLRLYSPKPSRYANRSAKVQLTLDPTCRYRISIQPSISGTMGQLARFYSPLLLVNSAAVVLMVLSSQLKNISKQRYCSMFFVAVKEGAKPYYILTFVKLLSRFLCTQSVISFLPAPDWLVMSEDGTDFFMLPLLAYICSVGIVWFMEMVLCISLVVFETTLHKAALKFLARTVSFTVSWSDYLMSALHKLPFVVAGTLICLSLTTTGSLALCLGTIFYFMRLTQLSQEYIEELVWFYVKKITKKFKRSKPNKKDDTKTKQKNKTSSVRNEENDLKNNDNNTGNNEETLAAHSAVFFHFTLCMIWSLVTIINVPSVLTWAHNFKYSSVLQPDPSFLPGFILSVCALPLWQLDLPKVDRKFYAELGQIVSALAVISLIYAPISIFRLNYILSSVILLVTLHQLIATNREDLVAPPSESDENISYDTVKAKLE